ncbi:hypothetical protein ACROYT_G030732 [Oculina patagonica]
MCTKRKKGLFKLKIRAKPDKALAIFWNQTEHPIKMASSTNEFPLEKNMSPSTADSKEVKIRSYHSSDYQDCREIFTQGMEQLISLVTHVVFPRYCWLLAVLSVFVFLAAFKYNLWIAPLYIFACVVLLSLLYVDVYLECWKYINSCLEMDLKNIKKSYMSSDGTHMWVAECNGKVVGMVGLIHNKSHKPGVAELQRMSVSPVCRRMGIARKLLDALLNHARDQHYEKIVLTTTSAQTPAIRLYKKYGFKLMTVFPYPQKILADLQYTCFDLRLND